MSHARPRRLRTVRADAIRPGMVLWSDASNRRLVVVTAHLERVPADANLYRDPEQPYDGPTTEAVVLMVVDEKTHEPQRLGAFGKQAGLQVVAQPLERASSPLRRVNGSG